MDQCASIAAGSRMDHQPDGLVEHQKIGILVEDFKIPRFRLDSPGQISGRRLAAKDLTIDNGMGRFDRLPAQEYAARPHPLLDLISWRLETVGE